MSLNNLQLEYNNCIENSVKAAIHILYDVDLFNGFENKDETFQDYTTFQKKLTGEANDSQGEYLETQVLTTLSSIEIVKKFKLKNEATSNRKRKSNKQIRIKNKNLHGRHQIFKAKEWYS